MIADTSYCYTSEDGDGSGNSVEGIDSNLRFGVRMKCNAKSWGTVDDFTLNKISD